MRLPVNNEQERDASSGGTEVKIVKKPKGKKARLSDLMVYKLTMLHAEQQIG